MDDNNLLMIVLAFIVGFMLQGMMKNMCGGQLVEGTSPLDYLPGGTFISDLKPLAVNTMIGKMPKNELVKLYNKLFKKDCDQNCEGISMTCKTGDPNRNGYNQTCKQYDINGILIATQWTIRPNI